MKKFFITVCALCAFALYAQAGAPRKNAMGFYEFDTFQFIAKKGEWDKARNWKPETVPTSVARIEIKGGATVTISKPVALLAAFNVGTQQPGKTELYVDGDAKIVAASLQLPYNEKNAGATCFMKGGELQVGKDEFGIDGTLDVGKNTTYSGTGHFVISGGKLTAGIKVGSDTPNTNTGIFTVKGSLPQIAPHSGPNNFFMLLASGTLEFVLDEKGVAALDYRKARVWLYNGGLLRVDGSAYRGPTKTIPLIECDALTVQNIRKEISGFNAPYSASLSFDGKRALLKISK